MNTLQARQTPNRDLSEVPSSQRRPAPQPFAYYEKQYHNRDQAIAQVYATGGTP